MEATDITKDMSLAEKVEALEARTNLLGSLLAMLLADKMAEDILAESVSDVARMN